MVDVPVVAAARLEGHVEDGQVVGGTGERLEVALADEVLGKGGVLLAKAKESAVPLGFCLVVAIDLLGHVEGSPGVGPAGVEGDVREDLGHLLARHAVRAGACQVILERAVGDALADERAHGDDAAQLERELVFAAPHLAKEDVIVQVRELGGELAKGVVACGLFDGHGYSFVWHFCCRV